MPGGNGTGPQGMGPMSGRAAGYCAGYAGPGFANPVGGRGNGFGRGGGRGGGGRGGGGRGGGGQGWRHRFYATGLPGWQRAVPPQVNEGAPPSSDEEISTLRLQVEQYEAALQEMRQRMERLEQDTKGNA
jgi:hypothetical protein